MKILLFALLLCSLDLGREQSRPVERTYNLKDSCHYSFRSEKVFQNLPESDHCSLNSAKRVTGLFFSNIHSNEAALTEDGVYGNLSSHNGSIQLLVRSYYDDARDFRQNVIYTKTVEVPNLALSSFITVALIQVSYSVESEGSSTLSDVDMIQECWYSFSRGSKTAVLTSLCEPHSGDISQVGLQSAWQAKLISSIVVD